MTNLNSHITDELEKLKDIYENVNDKRLMLAYWKAVTFIKGLDKRITDVEDVRNLPHVGEKIWEKIKEILVSGSL